MMFTVDWLNSFMADFESIRQYFAVLFVVNDWRNLLNVDENSWNLRILNKTVEQFRSEQWMRTV